MILGTVLSDLNVPLSSVDLVPVVKATVAVFSAVPATERLEPLGLLVGQCLINIHKQQSD